LQILFIVKNDPFNGRFFVKRLIGLPGDRVVVQDGKTIIYNENYPNGAIYISLFPKSDAMKKNIEFIIMSDGIVSFESFC
jgi:signal peptidase I